MQDQQMNRCATCGVAWYGAHVCAGAETPADYKPLKDPGRVYVGPPSLSEDRIRAIIREELDREPDVWREYAEAVVAAFEYNAGTEWVSSQQKHLDDAAREARKKYHAQHHP